MLDITKLVKGQLLYKQFSDGSVQEYVVTRAYDVHRSIEIDHTDSEHCQTLSNNTKDLDKYQLEKPTPGKTRFP